MFSKNFSSFLEGFFEVFNNVGSVWQSLLSNFSCNGAEELPHYETEKKDPLFREWIQNQKVPEKAILRLLLENLGGFGAAELRSAGSAEWVLYQTSGGLVWGWKREYSTLHRHEDCWTLFVRHPHSDPAPEGSSLRETLESQGWREGWIPEGIPLPEVG
jgi:hypothetical protein